MCIYIYILLLCSVYVWWYFQNIVPNIVTEPKCIVYLSLSLLSHSPFPLRFRLLTDSSPFLWEFVDVHFPETSGRRRSLPVRWLGGYKLFEFLSAFACAEFSLIWQCAWEHANCDPRSWRACCAIRLLLIYSCVYFACFRVIYGRGLFYSELVGIYGNV